MVERVVHPQASKDPDHLDAGDAVVQPRVHTRSGGRAFLYNALIVGVAFVATHVPGFVLTRQLGLSFRQPGTWAKWDSGLYLDIANRGFILTPCDGVANRLPTDWCGNSGWFPGYPFTMRALAATAHIGTDRAGLLISRLALLAVLSILWFVFLKDRPRIEGFVALGLACVFPGGVYFLALFPMSLAVLGLLVLLTGVHLRRSSLAFVGAAVAAFSYPGAVMGGVAVAAALVIHPESRRSLRRVSVGAAAGGALGLIATFVVMQATVHRWNAFFLTQASYKHPKAFPLVHILSRIVPITQPENPSESVPSAQYLLMLLLIGTVSWTLLRRRTWPSPLDFAIMAMVLTIYFTSNYYGAGSAQFRHQALLFPLVIVLRHVGKMQKVYVVAAAVITFQMTALFLTAAIT
jgi:hypothetical protein